MHILFRNGYIYIYIYIYKGYSDNTKRVYFLIKDDKNFDKYMTIWEKYSNIIKKT